MTLIEQVSAIDQDATHEQVRDAALRCYDLAKSSRIADRAIAACALKRIKDMIALNFEPIDPHSAFAFRGGRQR